MHFGIGLASSEAADFPVLNVSILRDNTHNLTIEQVSGSSFQRQFQQVSSLNLNFGLSPDTYWLKVSVRQTANKSNSWYLEVDYPPLDTVELYSPTPAGGWMVQKSGDKILWDEQVIHYRKPLFHLELADASWHTYYLKVNTQGTVQIPLRLQATGKMITEIVRAEFVEGLFYGAMMLMVLYNLFLFFSLKEKSYLYYCFFILSNTIVLAGLQGQLSYYIFQQSWWYDRAFMSVFSATVFWALIFAISFLQIRNLAPKLFLALSALAVINGVACLLAYILPYQVSANGVAVLVAIASLTAWWSGVVAWRRGNTSARFFVLAWTCYLISTTLISLRNFGLITDYVHLENMMQIGSVLEALLLSLALADRINIYRAEKIKAQQEALQASLENEQLVREQNQMLEVRIKERTQEISDQNEELLSQQEIIEELNRQLILYSEDLEEEVIKRTAEVTKTNKRLVQQNSRLERFAYIVSHNLRGPIAQILGVIGILDNNNLTSHNQKCFTHLGQSSQRLDMVIKDLNQTLVYRNIANYQFEPVLVKEAVEKVLEKMQSVILEEKVQIHNHLHDHDKVQVIKPYLLSILDHLISNAIKYRSEERPVEIHFTSRKQGNQFILTIADNGLGIDLEKYQDKIFSLYQRFHLHQEGRGVGLYMVKTQVEAMEGQVEVNSIVGQGTAFRLYLKACVSSAVPAYLKSPSA
ncbi:MAG: sensor histidine kinase [Cyclobacteriaceae bacterium]